MASAIIFSGQIPRQNFCFKAMAAATPAAMPFKLSSQFAHRNTKMGQQGICLRRQTLSKPFDNWRLNLIMPSAADSDDITFDQLSAALMIRNFYTCINEKRLKELDEYISDDCCFEDCSFVSPIQGKKEVMHFYQQLTTGMGHNVKFSIEHVCEDDNKFTAGVNWHMEWKRRQIPFTRGCSFYECSREGDRLVIKKARVVIESPIKPGGMVLTLLKNVTAIFDDFPKFAEWFLKSPHVIVRFLLKIYSRLLAPIVNPLLRGYVKIWGFVARLFVFALSILLHISKKYFG
ncbi:hypothetical protein P3X46_016759 [Hevea brasiliensis]|uniref:SnoaL-like domain-containing protein n=1 Tax=Hevea brasiliensis TaxID=3981 RepID=A0ABQ9M1B9_HEVBR|nr:uncharacterized protein LOC110658449 [Hevea brasiliensis]KAJ9173643.1 hypothetical protein P3X46_016759 [Hevea brasiliensis]